ncbi:hypothetical protein [Streptomyces sp. TP-A0874]|uniref:hypothetical protein n=1 Tax=Streptomyces sp. TP-A0874 TaxID=549819 RepID=UPI000853D739|nr:hypothetical protein [Streptomyces sp. TP-A0874]
MSEQLLYVLSEPGAVPLEEFHTWYDQDHGPARMGVPGIEDGRRYRALDDRAPGWLATYELAPGALSGPEYQRVRQRSRYEAELVSRLATLDRRVYGLVDDHGRPPTAPAVLLSVALSTTDEEALHSWYTEEHIPLLHSIEGWWRTRRYRLLEGAGPSFLALHEIADTGLFEDETYLRAVSTERRERVMASVTARERRVFGFHRRLRALVAEGAERSGGDD